jgi:hypothetical protein
MRVFLGGSRRVSRLNESIRRRLEELVTRHMQIVIGDANGADRAMQRQLAEWGYGDVVVYYVGRRPRNNEGAWPTEHVATAPGLRGAEFYAAKDRAMARSAECGLMLWDGVSRGTRANVETLVEAGKPVSLYVSPARRFVSVTSADDLRALVETKRLAPSRAAQGELAMGQPRASGRKRRRRSA